MVWSTQLAKTFARSKKPATTNLCALIMPWINNIQLTKHFELSGMDEILIDKVKTVTTSSTSTVDIRNFVKQQVATEANGTNWTD